MFCMSSMEDSGNDLVKTSVLEHIGNWMIDYGVLHQCEKYFVQV